MPTDTRSAVVEAIERLSSEPETDTAAGPVEPSGDTGAEVEATSQAEPESTPESAVRDDKGRFSAARKPAAPVRAVTPKADAASGQGPADGAPSPASSAAPALPELKPPQNWRAAARDKWGTVPRDVQEEALRVHAEVQKTLQRAADLEKEAGAWKEPLAPYEHIFRARGQTTQQGVGNLVQTYAALHTAPMPIRAKILGQLIGDHLGRDENAIRMLAAELDGAGAGQPVAPPPAMNQEQIRQLARQEWESAQQEQGRSVAIKTWQEFEPTANLLNEEGVRSDLAELAGKWTRENPGQTPTKEVFQKLYERACLMNEGAAKIWNQKKEAAAVTAANAKKASTTAAAASGVKNEPAGPSGSGDGPAKDTREEVARQFRKARQARV